MEYFSVCTTMMWPNTYELVHLLTTHFHTLKRIRSTFLPSLKVFFVFIMMTDISQPKKLLGYLRTTLFELHLLEDTIVMTCYGQPTKSSFSCSPS